MSAILLERDLHEKKQKVADAVKLYIQSLPTIQAKQPYLIKYIGNKCADFAYNNYDLYVASSIEAIGNSALKSIDWTEYDRIKDNGLN